MSQRSAGEFTPLLIAGKIGGRNLLDQGGDAAYAVVWKARILPLTFVCARVDDACHFCNAYMFATSCDMLGPLIFAFFHLALKSRTLGLKNDCVLCAAALLRAPMAMKIRMHDLHGRIGQC